MEGDPPNLPEDNYSDIAKDFVQSCVRKIPKMRPTYALLLKHPWLSSLSKPETIKEEVEESEDTDKVTDGLDQLSLDGNVEDAEVANWVKSVLQGKRDGTAPMDASKPALHTAPLDSLSPLNSPIAAEDS